MSADSNFTGVRGRHRATTTTVLAQLPGRNIRQRSTVINQVTALSHVAAVANGDWQALCGSNTAFHLRVRFASNASSRHLSYSYDDKPTCCFSAVTIQAVREAATICPSDINKTKFSRPRPIPIFFVADRSCPKTDGLRPHH